MAGLSFGPANHTIQEFIMKKFDLKSLDWKINQTTDKEEARAYNIAKLQILRLARGRKVARRYEKQYQKDEALSLCNKMAKIILGKIIFAINSGDYSDIEDLETIGNKNYGEICYRIQNLLGKFENFIAFMDGDKL
jgi:hypothetical protein